MKKKKSKKIQKHIHLFLLNLFFIIGIALLFQGITLFWVGFHGIDIAHNMITLEYKYNITMSDLDSNFNLKNSDEVYIRSINQMERGLKFSLLAMFMLGIVYIQLEK